MNGEKKKESLSPVLLYGAEKGFSRKPFPSVSRIKCKVQQQQSSSQKVTLFSPFLWTPPAHGHPIPLCAAFAPLQGSPREQHGSLLCLGTIQSCSWCVPASTNLQSASKQPPACPRVRFGRKAGGPSPSCVYSCNPP